MLPAPHSTAVIAALCASVLAGCADEPEVGAFTGTRSIDVEGRSVSVSCLGQPVEDSPIVVLMAGAGDTLDKLTGIQQTLSTEGRVCAYDRLGEGASDQPAGPQDITSTAKVLTGVLDELAGDRPVVLAGHSLGGLIAARYAPDHQDRVAGVVLMDATPPTAIGDVTALVPDTASSPAVDIRGQMLALSAGENPELLRLADGDVRSAGSIPVEVITHTPGFLTAIPEYGDGLERVWSEGQQEWLGISSDSTLTVATQSTHDIYVDQPDLAVQAIQRVTSAVEEYL